MNARSGVGIFSHRGTGPFIRHLGEMTLAMLVGMAASVPVLWLLFSTVLAARIRGLPTDTVFAQYAVLICVVVAVSMTVPMVAWMRHRGHGWRACGEMAAAMVAPLVPIFGLLWAGIIVGGSACGVYCVVMWPAMIAAMLLRRDELSAGHRRHEHAAPATT